MPVPEQEQGPIGRTEAGLERIDYDLRAAALRRAALRIEFAKAALAGRATAGRNSETTLADWADKIAVQAVALADATLAELDRTGGGA
jgi:hypothetical protein